MNVTGDNLIVVAAKAYTNASCASTEEFLNDLSMHLLIKKLAGKIARGSSNNIRLLVNHIICFTNNFQIPFVKHILLADVDKQQYGVILAVLLYLGYIQRHEYSSTDLNFDILVLLKQMD